ncbi:MAG: glycosyl transferase, partial [Pseudomonadota bacterium]
WQAHREHYYQRLIRMGWSHRRTALVEYALMSAVGVSGVLALGQTPSRQFCLLLTWALIYLASMARIDALWRQFSAKQVAK